MNPHSTPSEAGRTYITVSFGNIIYPKPRNWRCNNCGRLLFVYNAKVVSIVEGKILPEDAREPGNVEMHKFVDYMCHRCEYVYRCIF